MVVALIAAADAARAETRLSLVDPKFSERYAESAQVSGSQIAGIMYVLPSQTFKTDALRVAVPPTDPDRLCLAVTTIDGRYSAKNAYAVPASTTPQMGSPDFKTEYAVKLREYSTDEIAVAAAFAADCTVAAERRYVVSTLDGLAGQIVIKANALGLKTKASLSLDRNGAIIVEATCKRPSNGPLIAYDTECVLALPATLPQRQLWLALTRRQATGGTTTEHFPIEFVSFGQTLSP